MNSFIYSPTGRDFEDYTNHLREYISNELNITFETQKSYGSEIYFSYSHHISTADFNFISEVGIVLYEHYKLYDSIPELQVKIDTLYMEIEFMFVSKILN